MGGTSIVLIYRIVGRLRPGPVTSGFRGGQVISGGLLALAHGTNDAQKTMGVIALALVAYGSLPASDPTPPTWVVVTAATAIALGTYVGGWRIIKTMGSRIHKMDSAQGFAAQGAGAAVILASTHGGFPLSTTHTISGAVIGSGAAKRLSAVRWGVAGNIVVAWVVTLPVAAIIGAVAYAVTRLFGTGAAGPLVVSAADRRRVGASSSRGARSRVRPSRRRRSDVRDDRLGRDAHRDLVVRCWPGSARRPPTAWRSWAGNRAVELGRERARWARPPSTG